MSVAVVQEPGQVIITGDNQAILVQPPTETMPVLVESPAEVMPVVVEFGGPQGVPGTGEGGGDLHYVFTQGSPSTKWTIKHSLNKFPSIFAQDSANDEVEGDVEYLNPNELIITFSSAFSGKAYLN